MMALSCPSPECSYQHRKATKLVKHFKERHPGDWCLTCVHCNYFVSKSRQDLQEHAVECHHEDKADYFGSCFSSCELKRQRFKSNKFSFAMHFHCLLCRFSVYDVSKFNRHMQDNHSEAMSHDDNEPTEIKMNIPLNVENSENNPHNSLDFELHPNPSAPSDSIKQEEVSDNNIADMTGNNTSSSESNSLHSISDDALLRSFQNNHDNDEAEEKFISTYRPRSPKEGKGTHPCPQCGVLFVRQRDIKSHMVVHSNLRPFKCEFCEYAAKRPNDVVIHINKVHLHERPFKCEVCPKTFGFLTNLKRHMYTHEENQVKRFPCPYCLSRFTRSYSLAKHLKAKHQFT